MVEMRDPMVREMHCAPRRWGQRVGENMCTNRELETRIVILEAALDWVRHEASGRTCDRRSMQRIAAIATQVLEDDERTMTRRLAYADRSPESGVRTIDATSETDEAELRAG